jgi:preprotein translocase subunit SecE
MMQRQGQMEADGSPPSRKPPAGASGRPSPQGRGGAPRNRTSILQFFREIRDELRQVAWPNRGEMINYTTVVFFTLVLMISLIFVLNLGLGKAVFFMFQK